MVINYRDYKFPLPDYQHVPGVNARHAEDEFDFIKAITPPVTVAKDALQNPAWRYGIKLFNHGFYWECHEVLEEVWNNAVPNSRERFLVQGIIHLSNAALKEKMDRQKAARKLSVLAAECFERLGRNPPDEVFMGVPLLELMATARASNISNERLKVARI